MLEPQFEPKYISGIPLHTTPKPVILDYINYGIVHDRKKRHICITNTESMYYAKRKECFLDYIKSATFSLCDGIGLVMAGKVQGQNITRFNGPDLLLECCNYGQEYGWKHFFCGGKEGVADLLVDNLKSKYPKLSIAGTFCPPFREMNDVEIKEMIDEINASNADIIWVGLGLLKQEQWIANNKNNLNIPWAVGVGAAFDFYAGTVKRAPLIFRKIGLEWLYRLILEPRMFKRNVNSYKFFVQSIKEGIKNKIK